MKLKGLSNAELRKNYIRGHCQNFSLVVIRDPLSVMNKLKGVLDFASISSSVLVDSDYVLIEFDSIHEAYRFILPLDPAVKVELWDHGQLVARRNGSGEFESIKEGAE